MKGAVIHVLGDCVQSAGVALVSPENIAAPPPSNLAKLKQGVIACRVRVHEQVCQHRAGPRPVPAKAGHGNNRQHCI